MKGGAYTYYHIIIFITLIIGILYIHTILDKYTPTDALYNVPFHIRSSSTDAPKSVSGVPLVIYQSWHSNQVPLKMQDTIYALLKMNPEFDYYLYSDEKSREFIKENFDKEVLDAFDLLKPGAYKSDLWRYCVLYKKGGVYLDIKYYSLVPLISIIKTNPVIFVRDIPINITLQNNILFYNAFMVSPSNNLVFKDSINEIVKNCKLKLYKSGPLDITGPGCIVNFVKKYYGDNYVNNTEFYVSCSSIFNYILYRQTVIKYKNSVILETYKEYRGEQRHFQKSDHYISMWANGTVYNKIEGFINLLYKK